VTPKTERRAQIKGGKSQKGSTRPKRETPEGDQKGAKGTPGPKGNPETQIEDINPQIEGKVPLREGKSPILKGE